MKRNSLRVCYVSTAGAGLAVAAGLLLALGAGAATRPASRPAASKALVAAAGRAIQPEIRRRLADQDAKVRGQLAVGVKFPALLKTPVRVKGAVDPWAGMAELEAHGLRLASVAGDKPYVLWDVLDRLCAADGRPCGEVRPPVLKTLKLATLGDHVKYITRRLDIAAKLREEALQKISPKARAFMHKWPATIVNTLHTQIVLNAKTRPLCQNDRAFYGLSRTQFDWRKLTAAAKVLSSLGEEAYLASLVEACKTAKPIAEEVAGVTGDILYSGRSDSGLVLIGGRGANTYNVKAPVAIIVDIGGDDRYGAAAGASRDATHANSVVIDLAGDDTYECEPFGLATGRLGVGMVIDRRGNDTYKLASGSGGVGFAGIGILLDAAGNDTYVGSKFTQGAGVAGIGLLLDLAGDDKHTSFGYAVGFGGPGGIGAVIDAAGNDSYQCGGKYPSNYNRTDHPNAKEGDPEFQYWAFGLGTGMGRRILSRNPADHAWSLAGGIGMVLDLAGDDRYESSNFSQGCGYFFGVGLKLDLAGRDVHRAARYGMAAGAHFGMGLFVDYAGRDTYGTVGPTYNCGCAWDRSAFLFIDGGAEDDTYQLKRSSGLGRADINSWGVFADMGGRDTYVIPGGLGGATRTSLAVFYDSAGRDDYRGVSGGKSGLSDGLTRVNGDGGLFIDAGAPTGEKSKSR